MLSPLNLTRSVSLLRTSRPDVRSFATIALTTSTPFHLLWSPHRSKSSSLVSLLHLFGTLALVIPALLLSTNFKGPAPLRVIRVIKACVTLANLGNMCDCHLVLLHHHPNVLLNCYIKMSGHRSLSAPPSLNITCLYLMISLISVVPFLSNISLMFLLYLLHFILMFAPSLIYRSRSYRLTMAPIL
jgi:hypothetical protein